jgi:ubiquinone/menaquinone biosynthesis C-methylase UbiE
VHCRRDAAATRASLAEYGTSVFGQYLVSWDSAYETLVNGGIVRADGDSYLLTAAGKVLADDVHRGTPPWLYFYKEFFARAPRSPAYRAFCESVYGEYLCQQGQVDMAQLDIAIRVLGVTDSDRVLDLGCGSGMMAAHIAEATGASVAGVAFVEEAIAFARQLPPAKHGRTEFCLMNVNDVRLREGSFDKVLSANTLHLSYDLAGVLETLRRVVQPRGEMALFWETWVRPEKSREMLEPHGSKLARTLESLGLSYTAHDLGAQNDEQWRKKINTLAVLKCRFESEGNSCLHDRLLAETRRCEWGTGARFLYHVCT